MRLPAEFNHITNQCWLIVNWALRNKLQWNANQNTKQFMKMHLKMLSAKWLTFWEGELNHCSWIRMGYVIWWPSLRILFWYPIILIKSLWMKWSLLWREKNILFYWGNVACYDLLVFVAIRYELLLLGCLQIFILSDYTPNTTKLLGVYWFHSIHLSVPHPVSALQRLQF